MRPPRAHFDDFRHLRSHIEFGGSSRGFVISIDQGGPASSAALTSRTPKWKTRPNSIDFYATTEASHQPSMPDHNAEVRKFVCEAIDEAEPARLRKLLKDAMDWNEEVFRWLKGQMLVSDSSDKGDIGVDDEEDEEEEEDEKVDKGNKKDDGGNAATSLGQLSGKRKRLRPRFAMCENCEEEFDTAQRKSKDCFYHTGLSNPLHAMISGLEVPAQARDFCLLFLCTNRLSRG